MRPEEALCPDLIGINLDYSITCNIIFFLFFLLKTADFACMRSSIWLEPLAGALPHFILYNLYFYELLRDNYLLFLVNT